MTSTDEIKRKIIRDLFNLSKKINKLDSIPTTFDNGETLYPSEIHIIEAIGIKGSNTVNELRDSFGVTKGAISQVVTKLEQKGYVTKERNPDFPKEKILTLTDKGREVDKWHDEFHDKIDNDFIKSISDIDDKKIENFETILTQIIKHVDHYLEAKV